MFVVLYPFLLLFVQSFAEDFYYYHQNVTRSTLSGTAAYRSSLTLEWLAAEGSRQRERASAFETEMPPVKVISTDCIAYPRPAPGKIGRLMLELLKNLEGDDGSLITELIKILIRSKLLMENSIMEMEPDFEALVKTPWVMIGEPHTTFPRIVEVVWMLVTDPSTTRKYGWCPVSKVNKFLIISKPADIVKQMRSIDVMVSRARYIMEEFIQNVTPMSMYQKTRLQPRKEATTRRHAMKPRAYEKEAFSHNDEFSRSSLSHMDVYSELFPENKVVVSNDCSNDQMKSFLFLPVLLYLH